MLNFIKNWTLPLAMLAGVLGYLAFVNFSFLEPTKPFVKDLIAFLTPTLIFAQLLLTFCKVNVRDLLPVRWHLWLLLFQIVSCLLMVVILLVCDMNEDYKNIFEGAMVCFICPTATAAAVITGKLGGSISALTTYTLLSNILAAVAVPLLFPLVEPHADLSFLTAFLKILSKVFPLLLCPFFLAWFIRLCLPKLHKLLLSMHDLAFYLWAVALTIVTAQTFKSMMEGDSSIGTIIFIALGGFLSCVLQFYFGKKIADPYNDRISGGQALGQKNTVLAIWMAYTYLNPVSSLAPGSYVLWQNTFNSWQLWKKRKNEKK